MEELAFVKIKKMKKVKCLSCRKNFFASEKECPHCGYDNSDGPVCSCGSGQPKAHCCFSQNTWLNIDNEIQRSDSVVEKEGITRIFIEEEYGYRYWMWYFEGTIEDIIKWWQEILSVEGFYFSAGLLAKLNLGKIEQIEHDNILFLTRRAPVYIHMHMDDDSWIEISDNEWQGKRFFSFVQKKDKEGEE